jgi:hypothetical protein
VRWLIVIALFCSPRPVAAQEANVDAGTDTGTDAGTDTGTDAGTDAETDAETDTGTEAETAAGPPEDTLPEDLRPTLTVVAEPASGVMTGDLVTLVITAEAHAEGDDVAVPRQELAPFEVLDSAAEHTGARFTFRVELLALEPGEHAVGPVRLRVVTADGTLGDVHTAPVVVTVGSVLGNEPDAQPKPPTEPVDVVEEDYTLAWIGGGLLGLLLLALTMFFVARWWVRRERPAPPPPPPRPAWETAMEELAALRKSLDDDDEAGRLGRWVDSLSDTLRVYLGARYGFDGIESTTDEAISFLRKKRPPGITPEQVAGILSDCDLVKFAKATPDRERCLALLDAAIGIVKATTARLGGEVATTVPGKPEVEAAP